MIKGEAPGTSTIEIARRFCGPPQSGNGGYVAGILASRVVATPGAGAVAVRLFAPPPLGRALEIRRGADGRVGLFDGDEAIAEARPVELDLAVPSAPDYATATEAARGYRGFTDHPFPSCFVCGPERDAGDGLRIFPGPDGADGAFAAPWLPDASLASKESDRVRPEFLWAALDCPGAFSFPQPEGKVVLLGELQARVEDSVAVGERCVLSSWYLEKKGRKHTTGSAIHGEDGRLCGVAQGIWIEIEPNAVPRS